MIADKMVGKMPEFQKEVKDGSLNRRGYL